MLESYKYEFKTYNQSYYGGYCNKARNLNLEPIPYHIFTQVMKGCMRLSRKLTMDKLIEYTKHYRMG